MVAALGARGSRPWRRASRTMASSLGSSVPMVLGVVTSPLLPPDCSVASPRTHPGKRRGYWPRDGWSGQMGAYTQASFSTGGLELLAELADCRQPPIWLHVQDDLEIASAPQDRVDRPFREDGQRLQCRVTRLLRFANLRQRRGQIKAGKRSVGGPSTRPRGS